MKAYKSELAERCTQEQLHEAVHGKKLQTKPQTKPLSDEVIQNMYSLWLAMGNNPIKEIEEMHGIK